MKPRKSTTNNEKKLQLGNKFAFITEKDDESTRVPKLKLRWLEILFTVSQPVTCCCHRNHSESEVSLENMGIRTLSHFTVSCSSLVAQKRRWGVRFVRTTGWPSTGEGQEGRGKRWRSTENFCHSSSSGGIEWKWLMLYVRRNYN